MAEKKVLIVGDVGVDRYTLGAVERISPEAPVPILRVLEERLKLGLAANVADNVKTLGGEPILAGVIGKDRAAQDFQALIKEAGIQGNSLIPDPARRTCLKERVVSSQQQLLRIDYESLGVLSQRTKRALTRVILEAYEQVDAVVFEDYAKGIFLDSKWFLSMIGQARRRKKLICIDPNAATPVSYYRGATVLTPNLREAESLSTLKIRDQRSLKEAGSRILKATGARFVVITRGPDGMAVFSKNAPLRLIPTYAREVYDVSGAGDTVIAFMSLALSAGASIHDAAQAANLAAGVVVGKRGTATVTPSEVLAALSSFKKTIPPQV